MTECEVCGRDEAGLEEIGYDPEFKEHQGITKCLKCISEFNAESHQGQEEENKKQPAEQVDTSDQGNVRKGTEDWKDELGYA